MTQNQDHDRDPVYRAAKLWIPYEIPMSQRADLMPAAMQRVKDIFAGRVRWDDMTPQDREVWFCRPSDPALLDSPHGWDQMWDTAVVGPGSDAFNLRYGISRPTLTSSMFTADAPCGERRMFGSGTVGNVYMSNLYFGGAPRCRLYRDTLQLTKIWVNANRGSKIGELVRLALFIGGGPPVGEWDLNNLIEGVAIDHEIQPAQNISCWLAWENLGWPIYIQAHMDGPISPRRI